MWRTICIALEFSDSELQGLKATVVVFGSANLTSGLALEGLGPQAAHTQGPFLASGLVWSSRDGDWP